MTRTFVGLGQHDGWKFTLEECGNGHGSPGFLSRQLSPSAANLEALQHINPTNERLSPGYNAEMRELVMNPPPVWREEQWLTEWLKRGLIKEVTP
jgi:hypothetical protein